VVRPYLVARRHRLSTSGAFASIILERLVDLITVLALFGLYLLVLPLPPQQRTGPLLGLLKIGGAFAAAAAIAVLLALVAYHAYTDRALALLERVFKHLPERWAQAASSGLRAFGEGLAVLRAPAPQLLLIAGQSVAVWMAIALGIYLNNVAFGLDLGFTTTFLILGFLTVGVAIPTPGMVGGFHESYLLALTQAFGADRDVAAAAGIALHALNSLPVLVLGLLLIGGEGLTLGRVAAMAEHPEDPPDGRPEAAGKQTGGD
jgi:glycosyltransferase 2 family protein